VVREMLSQPGRKASVSAIADAFNDAARDRLPRPVSPRWVGEFLRTRLKLATVRANGVFVVPLSESGKLDVLCVRYGVSQADGSATPTAAAVGTSTKSTLAQSEPSGEYKDKDLRGSYQPDLFTI